MVFLKKVVIAALATGLCMENANAYLDPGTGSMLIQGLIATIAAALVAIRLYWYKILKFFGLEKTADEDPAESEKPN